LAKKRAQRQNEQDEGTSAGDDGPINPPLTFELAVDGTHPCIGERIDAMQLGDHSIAPDELIGCFGPVCPCASKFVWVVSPS